MQLGPNTGTNATFLFQSSPAPEDRCNNRRSVLQGREYVSILTGPGGPVQHGLIRPDVPPQQSEGHGQAQDLRVSILTGPRRTGAAISNPRGCGGGEVVSILTGPGGPVQPQLLC